MNSTWNQRPWWSRPGLWWAIALLLALALIPRFVMLGSRPVIHDESMFSFYSLTFARSGHFLHMPIMHGPTLMLLTGWVFRAFGESIEVARAFVAVLSLVAMAASLALAPRTTRWWLAPLLLSSPILLYFSRFIRNEMLFCAVEMVGMMGMGFACLGRRGQGWWALLGVASMISLLAIKENSLFVYATGLTFFVVWAANRWLMRRQLRAGTATGPAPRWLARWRLGATAGWLGGSLLGLLLVAIVYGVTLGPGPRKQAVEAVVGQGAPNVAAVVARQESLPFAQSAQVMARQMAMSWLNLKGSWDYWEGQHSVQRISGALHYHVPILLTYELPLLLMLFAGLIWDAATQRRRAITYAGALIAWVAIWLLWRVIVEPEPPGLLARVQDFLHIGPSASMMWLGLMFTPLLAWALLELREGRSLAAWMGWWAACSLFQYSSAGEKVPWLAVHIALPFYLALAFVWEPRLRDFRIGGRRWAIAIVTVSTLLALRNDYYLIGERSADGSERMVYNHTTPWFDEFVRNRLAIWDESTSPIPLKQRRVILAGAPSWPGTWYFRDTRYKLVSRKSDLREEMDDVDLILAEEHQVDAFLETENADDWVIHRGMMRKHWWAPWPDEELWWPRKGERKDETRGFGMIRTLASDFVDLWRYYWLREPWSKVGGFPIATLEPRSRRMP